MYFVPPIHNFETWHFQVLFVESTQKADHQHSGCQSFFIGSNSTIYSNLHVINVLTPISLLKRQLSSFSVPEIKR